MNQEPLRVVQFNTVFNGGGTDNQTIELCRGLQALGHQPTLAIRAGCNWESVARRLETPLLVLRAGQHRKIARLPGLVRFLRTNRVQILHAHQGRDYWPAVAAARLARTGTQVVVTRHLMTRPSAFSRQFLLRACSVVAVSNAVNDVLRRELRGPTRRLHRIHPGIAVERFGAPEPETVAAFRREHGWSNDCVVFGILGRYRLPRGKGHLEFLEAAARTATRFPQARFAVVGRGSMGPLLSDRIAALGLEPVTRMIAFTTDVPRVMASLDVIVHPPHDTDAFPLVVLEAMAAGKPVIASRLDGIPEQIHSGRQGLLFAPGNAEALGDAMALLLEDPALRTRFGAAGRERVGRHFTFVRQAEQYAALYRALIAE